MCRQQNLDLMLHTINQEQVDPQTIVVPYIQVDHHLVRVRKSVFRLIWWALLTYETDILFNLRGTMDHWMAAFIWLPNRIVHMLAVYFLIKRLEKLMEKL